MYFIYLEKTDQFIPDTDHEPWLACYDYAFSKMKPLMFNTWIEAWLYSVWFRLKTSPLRSLSIKILKNVQYTTDGRKNSAWPISIKVKEGRKFDYKILFDYANNTIVKVWNKNSLGRMNTIPEYLRPTTKGVSRLGFLRKGLPYAYVYKFTDMYITKRISHGNKMITQTNLSYHRFFELPIPCNQDD